jgi:hypothetical protein
MKYIGLNNKTYTLNTTKYLKKPHNKSKLHLRVRKFLEEFLPFTVLLEEPPLKGFGKFTLYLDFLIPSLSVAIECDGPQHHQHIPFFHPTKADFLRAKKNDALKAEWCCINSIQLLRFDDSQTEATWKTLLNS